MKKVGLMTCFLDNYGACLQAYALTKAIQSIGLDCEILQYVEPQGYHKGGLVERVKDSAIYNKIRCCSPNYRRSFLCGKIKRKAFRAFRRQYLPISARRYDSFEQLRKANADYDMFVCGSDQIWNPSFYNGNNRAYFLDFAEPQKKKIAYAPSIGVDKISDAFAKQFGELVNKIDAISVREMRGVEIVRELSGREATLVLDPTLLLKGDQWISLLNEKRVIEEKYILCYLFGEHAEYKQVIDRLARMTNLKVVIIPFCEYHLTNNYTKVYAAGPLDFLNLIKNAEYVVTDSFHATVFSLLFTRRFFTLPRFKRNEKNSMNSRIYSLLNLVGLQDRLLDYSQIDSFDIDASIDYPSVQAKLEQMRKSSFDFLKGALECR